MIGGICSRLRIADSPWNSVKKTEVRLCDRGAGVEMPGSPKGHMTDLSATRPSRRLPRVDAVLHDAGEVEGSRLQQPDISIARGQGTLVVGERGPGQRAHTFLRDQPLPL